jgi:hypothetical protein
MKEKRNAEQSADQEDESSKKPGTEDELLTAAKRLGLDDKRTAEYAGITFDAFQARLQKDSALKMRLQQARMQGFGTHLQWVTRTSSWPAHKEVMEAFWPELFGPRAVNFSSESPMKHSFRDVVAKMTDDQLLRAAELLELGVSIDNERRAAVTSEDEPCKTNENRSLPDFSNNSAQKSPAEPSKACGDSSPLPGTCSNPRLPSSPDGISTPSASISSRSAEARSETC